MLPTTDDKIVFLVEATLDAAYRRDKDGDLYVRNYCIILARKFAEKNPTAPKMLIFYQAKKID